MILLCDTRQKKNKHKNIENYCKLNNITMIDKCLDVGDYMFPNGTIAVDTKQDLLELAKDLYQDKKAFNKKYKKCYEQGIELWVLVEEKINTLDELANWHNEHTKVNGRMLIDMIHRLKVSYGVRFKFASRQESPKILIEILKKEVNL